jgi:hypothetical protein
MMHQIHDKTYEKYERQVRGKASQSFPFQVLEASSVHRYSLSLSLSLSSTSNFSYSSRSSSLTFNCFICPLIIALGFLQNSLGRGSSSSLERISLSLETYLGEDEAFVFTFFYSPFP